MVSCSTGQPYTNETRTWQNTDSMLSASSSDTSAVQTSFIKVRVFVLEVIHLVLGCNNERILGLLCGCIAVMQERIIHNLFVLLDHLVVVADGEGATGDDRGFVSLDSSEVPE
jgi:hypothetical protein